jgi:hypothetical protein
MLWHKFASGADIGKSADSRMNWGTKLQPLILEQVADDKKLEVIPNIGDHYIRSQPIGCTRDATIICPDRGPGALEIKCVFDYRSWMTNWGGGNAVPRHYEIQLQHQMAVGDGHRAFQWGIVAVWVCAELFYFERSLVNEFHDALYAAVVEFFDSVERKVEPDAFGSPVEIPLLTRLYPTVADRVIDLSTDPDHVKTAEDVRMYEWHKQEEAGNKIAGEALRGKLLALARDASQVLLPCGFSYRVRNVGKGKMIVPYIPEMPSPPPIREGSILS